MQEDLSKLGKGKYVWIYGAGNVSRQVIRILSNRALNLEIQGVVVSRKDGQEECGGYKVCELKDVDTPDSDTIFVIAVSVKFQGEILEMLKEYGYSHYVIWKKEYVGEIWGIADYRFDDRRGYAKRACFILCGYKEFLWDNVFERLKRYVPEDLDVCLLSSGMVNKKLADMAERNGWSYLCTAINDVSLIQNIAFAIFDDAEWIYKMDEDIFLTEDCFDKLLRMYLDVEKREPYHIGFLAPLINVNGYGYLRILSHLHKREEYEERFGRAYYGANAQSMIEKDIYAAKYMWGWDERIPQLDELNDRLKDHTEYSICGMRFSIGFILINRKIWENMGGLTASGKLDMGADERELCQYCNLRSLVTVVAENTVVGHFSFGQQTAGMQEFYKENPELFRINRQKTN